MSEKKGGKDLSGTMKDLVSMILKSRDWRERMMKEPWLKICSLKLFPNEKKYIWPPMKHCLEVQIG